MARKSKRPELKCPKCQAAIVVIPQGKRFRACDAEAVMVIDPAGGATVTGYRRHACAAPRVARQRKVRPMTPEERPDAPGTPPRAE